MLVERPTLDAPALAGETLQQSGGRRSDSSFTLAVFFELGPRTQEIAGKQFCSVET